MRLSRPDSETIRRFLDEQRALPFSYEEIGHTRYGARTHRGFDVDHNRQLLGHGKELYLRAHAAIRAWKMFPEPWTAIEPKVSIHPEQTVAVLVHAVGLWWLNAARIVYVIDEPRRYGFAYGTLPGHAERGEERFSVEWLADDSVWYDLYAFSRPRHLAARVAAPMTRALQRRFARDSKAAMASACASASPSASASPGGPSG
ncbi:MAG TPA: DUF1990 domain-containing protein [Kofleriaceae bacterium]